LGPSAKTQNAASGAVSRFHGETAARQWAAAFALNAQGKSGLSAIGVADHRNDEFDWPAPGIFVRTFGIGVNAKPPSIQTNPHVHRNGR
jgi:hypothetical protein